MSKFKVYKKPCKNCLLSKNSIVSPERRSDILEQIKSKQSYFVCHNSTTSEESSEQGICCRKFYDDLGHVSQLIRIAERCNAIEFVDQPHEKKLISWREIKNKK